MVKQDALLERKESLLFGAQGGFNRAAFAIEPILIEFGEVRFENIAQRTAAYPFAHG